MIDNKFGKTHAKSILKFRELNKNLSFRIYSNQMMEDYMKKLGQKKIYQIFKNSLIDLSNLIFLDIVFCMIGGYYFDISRGCDVPLTKLHDKNTSFILTYEDTDCYIPPNNQKIFNLKDPLINAPMGTSL